MSGARSVSLVRAGIGGGGQRLGLFDSLGYVDSAAPDTAFRSSGTSAFTSKSASAIGSVLSYGTRSKMVHHLAAPCVVQTGRIARFITTSLLSNLPSVSAQNISGSAYFISVNTNVYARLSIITSDFVPSGVTWNTFSSLPLITGSGIQIGGGVAQVGSLSPGIVITCTASDGNVFEMIYSNSTGANVTIYGIVVEVGVQYLISASTPGPVYTVTTSAALPELQNTASTQKAFATGNYFNTVIF